MNKSVTIPAIIWQDIFNFDKNSNEQIAKDGIIYNGPSLNLRGMTSSIIDKNHAFIIYLFFKIREKGSRNLEENEKIKIKSICQTNKNSIIESSNGLFIVDYQCLPHNNINYDLSNYELELIEQEQNKKILQSSNDINDLLSQLTPDGISKIKSSFSFGDLFQYSNFIMNEIQNQTSKNFIFDFKINGKLDRDIKKSNISIDMNLNEIDDVAKCYFVIENDKNANLNCKIDINKYKNKNVFSFKTLEIKNENNNIFMSKLNEVYLINNENINDKAEKIKNNNNIGIIIGCVLAGIAIIIGGIILGIIIYKRKKVKNLNLNQIPISNVATNLKAINLGHSNFPSNLIN